MKLILLASLFALNNFNCQKIVLGNWTWISGSHAGNYPGSYGTMGVSTPENLPSSRYFHSMSMDSSINMIFVFGGSGYVEKSWGIYVII